MQVFGDARQRTGVASVRFWPVLFAIYLSFISVSSLGAVRISEQYTHDLPNDVKSGLGRDHAVLDADRNTDIDQFVSDTFLDEKGSISLQKVEALYQRLLNERTHTDRDLYESAVLEQVETDVISQDKAKKKAAEGKHGRARINHLYDDYLIPTVGKLRDLIQRNVATDAWEGLIHDFIRGYHAYYYPNARVTLWARNNDVKRILKHTVVPWKFKKDEPLQKEAINLIIENENASEIQKCLGPKAVPGHYLTQSEIQLLKRCSYDISQLNPGVSGLWEKRMQEEKDAYFKMLPDLFPAQDSPLHFVEIMLTGDASPKAQVRAMVHGKWYKYKLKWGRETHTDTAISFLNYLVGFNSDKMQYRKQAKVFLGKYTFENFMSLLMAKYGQASALRYISSHGGEKGNEWVMLQDVTLEARPVELEVRILPLDPTAMDFQHRREFNGRLLFNAFLNLVDGKIANFRILLGKRSKDHLSLFEDDPRPRILLRFQDLGYAFGSTLYLEKPQNVLFLSQKYLPNEFADSGIVKFDKEKDLLEIH